MVWILSTQHWALEAFSSEISELEAGLLVFGGMLRV